MQVLTLSTGSFDQDNTFALTIRKPRNLIRARVSLCRDYKTAGDGIYWAMKNSVVLKSYYTDKDIEEANRLINMEPVRDGDIVLIDGNQYKVRVLGDFSDCAIFDPIN